MDSATRIIIDSDLALDRHNWRMIRLMAKDICTVCENPVTMQIFKGTGVCSEDCKDKRDGKVQHPFVMPPHQKMGYTKPKDELDGIIMDASESGMNPGEIR